MDQENQNDETHIDNLLKLFGVKSSDESEELDARHNFPNAWKGRTNQAIDHGVSVKAPTHAQNQAAAKEMIHQAADSIANMELGNLDPRQIAYVPGAAAGMKYGPRIAHAFDPLVFKEQQADRARRWRELLPNETQAQYEMRMKLPGASGTRNYANVMPGQQIPEAVLETVEDMTKGNPRGKGAYDVAEKDAANLAKINAMGGSHYELTGEGLPQKAPKPFQLMMPHGQPITNASAVSNAASAISPESRLSVMLKAFPEYANMVLSNPVVKGGLHAANILGTGVQAATDIYNKDPVGGLITAGQLAGSALGSPELAIPAAELARHIRQNPEEFKKKLEPSPYPLFGTP